MNSIKDAIYYGRELFLAGINNGSNGNLSFKIKNKIYITKSGSVMSELKKSDLVAITAKSASCEAPAHNVFYQQKDKKIGAVLHVHSAQAIALSLKTKDNFIKPLDLEGKYHFPKIPVITTKLVPGAPDLPQKLIKNKDYGAVIVKGHGIFTFGKDIKECYLKAITIDNVCKIILFKIK